MLFGRTVLTHELMEWRRSNDTVSLEALTLGRPSLHYMAPKSMLPVRPPDLARRAGLTFTDLKVLHPGEGSACSKVAHLLPQTRRDKETTVKQ
jgi:hypothetical protein